MRYQKGPVEEIVPMNVYLVTKAQQLGQTFSTRVLRGLRTVSTILPVNIKGVRCEGDGSCYEDAHMKRT